jgi:alpha-ketoglutarate-dependent taurine dioxygenase
MRTVKISEKFGTTLESSPGETIFDLDQERIRDLIKTRGVVVFSGFGAKLADFDRYIKQFGDKFMSYQGGGYIRSKVSEDDTLLSTRYDYGREKQDTFGLPLHGEMYYTDLRPVLLWFFCERPADSDGETTVCDGAQIYDALSPKWKDLLARQKLRYVRRYLDGEWQLIYQTEDIDEAVRFCQGNGISAHVEDGRVLCSEYIHPAAINTRWGGHTSYINNILPVVWQEKNLGRKSSIVRLEDGSELPQELIDEVLATQQKHVIPLRWRAGDFAVIDNSRALHGRRAFQDTDREVFLRMVREVDF